MSAFWVLLSPPQSNTITRSFLAEVDTIAGAEVDAQLGHSLYDRFAIAHIA